MIDLKGFLSEVTPKKVYNEGNDRYTKISIITPSYNQGEFLKKNIISVINQGYPEYEHIIIDGGSTDFSIDILKSFGDRIAYWFSEPDRGQSHALNKGLSIASGDIIGWQNSDDLYLPETFYKIGDIFNRFPGVDVLYGDYLYIDEEDNIIIAKKYPPIFNIKEYVYVGANISNQAVFFKKSALIKAGGFNEKLHLAMDFDLFLRLSFFSRFKHIRSYLRAYRVHKDQKGEQSESETEQEYTMIRKDLGLKLRSDIPWKRQYPIKKFYYRTRRNILKLPYIFSYINDPIYRGI